MNVFSNNKALKSNNNSVVPFDEIKIQPKIKI